MTPELIVKTQQTTCRIELNRPAQLNSMTTELCQALQQALMHASSDNNIRCIYITGNGKGFCAGQDLSDLNIDSEQPGNIGHILENNINPIIQLMRSITTPIIVGVNGVAAGAGANLALAGDIVVAKKSAKFIQAFRHVGLIPDAGGTWHLPRLAGQARSLGMALLGEPVSADQAYDWGLIWKSVGDDEFENEIERICQTIASGPTTALGLTKQAIGVSMSNTLEQQLNIEKDFQIAASRGDDFKEGVQAFIEKRKSNFTGT